MKEIIVTTGTSKLNNENNKKCVILKDDDLTDDRIADDIN